jgi:hypothetical protein
MQAGLQIKVVKIWRNGGISTTFEIETEKHFKNQMIV